MERSLDLGLLAAALDGRSGIPSAEELQELMAQMEVRLFLRRPELDPDLLEAAWYLHGVASVDRARDRYSPQRQRQAFSVSAHIFDLALQQGGWPAAEQLSLGFAAATGYRRGGRDPNATAIFSRLRDLIIVDQPLASHVDTLPLEAGLAFLGFQTRTLFRWFGAWRRQLQALALESGLEDLSSTIFGPGQLVVLGADDLLAYFTDGDQSALERGRARLLRVIEVDDGQEDLHARWVAAHLLALAEEGEAGSLWNPKVIPPDVPAMVRRAFTVSTPAVLTLWEPQRELLTGERSPFDSAIRRMVLAVPTSGGKTLLAQLLAVEQLERTGCGVCYVAPTRSLCREVRQGLSGRVRFLQKETSTDEPDFPVGFRSAFVRLADLEPEPSEVEVMTPERLSNLLRHDPSGVLRRFGMFIFDEAQHLKQSGRGFVLESTIAALDYLTRDTEHRLVLISAAMGNAGAIASWISQSGEAPLLHESAWRGPRRLHAVFTTEAKFEETTVVRNPRARTWPFVHTTELTGLIRLRLANGKTTRLTTTEDTGWRLVRKAKSPERFPDEAQRDGAASTPLYKVAADMIRLLGHAGSVLVVANTRTDAQRLATSLAEEGVERPALAAAVGFVRGQLGADHPLVKTLRGGVGFHHAGLPTEVQEVLEQAVRDDTLPYLTCTSTLTDGVNLPVRTVVIYDTEYEGQPEDARLRGARLVNAIGRAGRAGKETEGWIVLTRAARPRESDFDDLDPDDETLAVTSSLTSVDALEEIAALEERLRDDEDAIFRATGQASTDFISFVWLMLAVEEERGAEGEAPDVDAIVDSTLAALESPKARAVLRRIGQTVAGRYRAADPTARRRWPRTGTSVGSARAIDDLASVIAETIALRAQRGEDDDLSDPSFLLKLPRILTTLLALPEAPTWRFRTTTHGDEIATDPAAVLADWLRGVDLAELANTHLSTAASAAWRIEQMVDAVTSHFEHYLAWTVGALVELVNLRLADQGVSRALCPELGGFVRYGVNDPRALILMTSGIRSRRLAHVVVADLPDDVPNKADDLRAFLAPIGVAGWRERYGATASEILDLLEFARPRRRSLLRTLLENGNVDIHLPSPIRSGPFRQLTVESQRDIPEPAPLAVYDGDELIATIASHDHSDINEILDTGVRVLLTISGEAATPTLTMSLTLRDQD